MAVGAFYAVWHFVWILLVAAKAAKPIMDWVLSLHFISLTYEIMPFTVGRTMFLVIFTFAIGYFVGWIFARLWNEPGDRFSVSR